MSMPKTKRRQHKQTEARRLELKGRKLANKVIATLQALEAPEGLISSTAFLATPKPRVVTTIEGEPEIEIRTQHMHNEMLRRTLEQLQALLGVRHKDPGRRIINQVFQAAMQLPNEAEDGRRVARFQQLMLMRGK